MGVGNLPDLAIKEDIQFFPQTNESLAQLLADHLRIKIKAFIRRSDYAPLSPSDDASLAPLYHADLIHRPIQLACCKHQV